MLNSIQSPLPADARQREQALTLGESFCVSAPAGSGKTELLSRRVLKLLAHCKEPEEILCITFTRKAAAEMKTRIMATLEKGKYSDAPDNEYQKQQWQLARAAYLKNEQLNWQLLENPNRLRIQTIDSFCHGLTRQLPLLSRMGASVVICEQTEKYYQQAARNLLSSIEHTSSNEDCRSALITVLEHMDNDIERVEQLFITMLRKRDQWLPLTETDFQFDEIRSLLEGWLQELISEHLRACHGLLKNYQDDIVSLASFSARNLAKNGKEHNLLSCMELSTLPKTNFENLPEWLGISDLLLTQSGTFRKTVNTNIGFDSDGTGTEKRLQKEKKQQYKDLIAILNDDIAEELSLLRKLPSPHYTSEQWQVLGALTTSLKYLAAHLQLVFQEHGEVDYPEVMAAALLALGDETQPTDLALILDQQINHILVDEFQDTSILQARLLEQLTATWTPDDHRTLFLVGDGMQSIYKFRNANVGLFLKARQFGIGHIPLTPLTLTVNFRSQTKVVDWINQHFSQAFPQQENISLGAITYSPSDTFNSNGHAEIKGFAFTGENAREQEAFQVVDLVQQCQKINPQQSIAILVRTRSHLNNILPALKDAGIPWLATELDSLSSNQVIQDLLTLTRAMHHLSDRNAWLALLRTPFCGLNLEDLHALANHNTESSDQLSIWQAILSFEEIKPLSNQGKNYLHRIRNCLQQALHDKYRKPVRAWIEGTWYALGGPLVAKRQELNDINAFFELLEAMETAAQLDVNLLAERIDTLYAQVEPDASANLQVMTMHKSKGLEFDTVIIPGLDRSPRNDDTPILRWYERINEQGKERLLMAPIAASGKDADAIFEYIKYEERRKTNLEATRLLYVACTRAKSHLYLTACLNIDNEKNESASPLEISDLKNPDNNSLLASIWTEFKHQCIINPKLSSMLLDSSKKKLNLAENQLSRISSNWVFPELPPGNLLEKYRGQEHLQDHKNKPELDLNIHDRHIGTVAHEALYIISKASASQRLENWQADNLNQYLPLWQSRLIQLGLDDLAANGCSVKIKALISNTLECKTGQWILDTNHKLAESELPITTYLNGQIREYIIDRTFVDNDNIRWIIDYKTSSPRHENETKTFLQFEKIKYQEKVLAYKNAIQKMDTRSTKIALYYPALKLLVNID